MDTPRRPRPSRNVLVLLAVLSVVAFALRWPATMRELPHLPEPDAFLVMHAQERVGDPAIVKHQEFAQRYPTLVTRIFQAFSPAVSSAPKPGGLDERAALEEAAAPYRRGRTIVLFLSMLLVPLTFVVARRFAHRPDVDGLVTPDASGGRSVLLRFTTADAGALLAATLVATSLIHALFSTQARPHGVHASLALLAVWSALRVLDRPSATRIAVAGACAALAVASLQSGFFTLPALGVALLLAEGSLLARLTRAVGVPLAAAAVAFAFYPVLPRIDASGVHLGGAGGHEMLFQQFTWQGLTAASYWFRGHDPLLYWGTLASLPFGAWWLVRGGPKLWRGSRRSLAVALAYVVPYAAVVALNDEIYERFLLPLLPWCAILVGVAWTRIASRPARAVSACTALLPFVVLVQFARVASAPDSLEEAAAWYRAHARETEDRAFATPGLALPLRYDPSVTAAAHGDGAAEGNPWFTWQAANPSPARGARIVPYPARLSGRRGDEAGMEGWLTTLAPRWAILEISRKSVSVPGLQRLRAWAEAHGELAYQSDGTVPEAVELGLVDYQSCADPARRLLSTRRFGPRIEIWRLVR